MKYFTDASELLSERSDTFAPNSINEKQTNEGLLNNHQIFMRRFIVGLPFSFSLFLKYTLSWFSLIIKTAMNSTLMIIIKISATSFHFASKSRASIAFWNSKRNFNFHFFTYIFLGANFLFYLDSYFTFFNVSFDYKYFQLLLGIWYVLWKPVFRFECKHLFWNAYFLIHLILLFSDT